MLLSFCHFLSGVAYVLLILKRVFQQSRQASIVCYTTQQKTNSVKTKGSSEKRHLSFEGYVIAPNEPTLPQLPSCYLVVYFSRFFKFPAIQIWLPFFTENLGVPKIWLTGVKKENYNRADSLWAKLFWKILINKVVLIYGKSWHHMVKVLLRLKYA